MLKKDGDPGSEGGNVEFSFVPGTLDILMEGDRYVQIWQGPVEGVQVMYMKCRDVETGDDLTYSANQFDVQRLRALSAKETIPEDQRPFAQRIDEDVMITGNIVPRPGGGRLGSPSELEE